ncbi:MAG: hypothetical protein IPJ88_02610 [Myxococcales bacterium]|nr:MAG: hypothetical protein IPJ88_02610 [Myxococcales bacterium]
MVKFSLPFISTLCALSLLQLPACTASPSHDETSSLSGAALYDVNVHQMVCIATRCADAEDKELCEQQSAEECLGSYADITTLLGTFSFSFDFFSAAAAVLTLFVFTLVGKDTFARVASSLTESVRNQIKHLQHYESSQLSSAEQIIAAELLVMHYQAQSASLDARSFAGHMLAIDRAVRSIDSQLNIITYLKTVWDVAAELIEWLRHHREGYLLQDAQSTHHWSSILFDIEQRYGTAIAEGFVLGEPKALWIVYMDDGSFMDLGDEPDALDDLIQELFEALHERARLDSAREVLEELLADYTELQPDENHLQSSIDIIDKALGDIDEETGAIIAQLGMNAEVENIEAIAEAILAALENYLAGMEDEDLQDELFQQVANLIHQTGYQLAEQSHSVGQALDEPDPELSEEVQWHNLIDNMMHGADMLGRLVQALDFMR